MAQFSGKLTLPHLLEQGMEKKLWQGKVIKVELITNNLIIIICSTGVELFDFKIQNTLWAIDCPTSCVYNSPSWKYLVICWMFHSYVWDLQQGKFICELKPKSAEIESGYITSNIVFYPTEKQLLLPHIKLA